MIYYRGMADNGGFSNVELPGGFSEKELRWSFWFVKHREQLRTIGLAIFAGIDLVLIVIGMWGIVDWLALSGVKEDLNVRALASSSYAQAPQGGGVQEITIDSPLVFSGTNGHYDFVATITNPNPLYWVELQYRFVVGDQETPLRAGFVLPGEEKKIAELGVAHDGGLGDVQMKIMKRAFHLVDRHVVPDYAAWSRTRLDMPATGAKFTPPTLGATVPTSETSLSMTNQTAYSYYDVPINVFVYRGDALVGANRVTFDRLKAGETKSVDLFWYQNLQSVTRIDAVPDLNIFDPGIYKPPGS